MAQQIINLGTSPNDGEGDNLRGAFDKVNDNFTEVYTAGPVGSNITISGATISTTTTNANLILSPDGTGKVVFQNDALPDQNNLRYLGSANLRYRGIYVGSAGVNTTGDLTVGNIIPAANVTYNLGSPTAQWQTLYVSGNTIYLDGQPLRVSGNTLSVNGGNVVLDTDITGYATESYVDTAISNVIGGAPGALDTLNELAAALNDDASFNATITNNLANKANVSDIPTHTSNLTNDSGFITGYTVTSNDVTQHQANLSITESQISDLSHTSTGNFTLTNNTIQTSSGDTGIDLVINGATSDDPPALVNKAWRFVNDGSLQFRSPMNLGAEVDATITSAKVSNWDTAYSWGDHSTQGYLTSVSGFITDNADDTMSGKLTISNSGTIGATTPDNGYLKITDGSSTLSLDPNEIYSTTNLQITTSTGTGITGNLTVTGNVSSDNFVGNVTGNLTGTASSATSASLASAISIVSTTGTAQEFPVLFASGSGNHTPRVDPTKLTFNPSTDTLSVNSATVTSTKIGQWDTAYGWGNHASAGYVESDTTGITGADQVTNMVSLTQAEYNAITPNASTVYFIVG